MVPLGFTSASNAVNEPELPNLYHNLTVALLTELLLSLTVTLTTGDTPFEIEIFEKTGADLSFWVCVVS